MDNKVININIVAQVARALKELKDQMVFIGGAVISLYTDDPSADEIRPTADIDMTVRLLNYSDWVKMQKRLAELRFFPDPDGHSIISYLYKGISVDIMPGEDGPMGPANRWYKLGFEDLHTIEVEDVELQVFSAPCYLATKFEAFNDRGGDYRTSHDFEDVIYVLDNRTTIVEEIDKAHSAIKAFLHSELNKILQSSYAEEIISVHLHPLVLEERYPMLMAKLQAITNQQG